MMNPTAPPSGHNIFVVEDETALSFLVEDMLEELGASVAGHAANPDAALKLLKSITPTLALLDVNLAGQPVYPVADQLRQRGIPFIFLTGYGRDGIDAEWSRYPVLQKPFDIEALAAAISQFPPTAA